MARRFLASTDDAALRPTVPPTLGFAYLRALVVRHVGEEAARLLAVPQAIPGEGRQQWTTEAGMGDTLARLGEAAPEAAGPARAALAAARDDARAAYQRLAASPTAADRQEAVLVLRAFEVPDDATFVWVVGARPVLVGWGHVATDARVLEAAELAVTWRRPLPPRTPPEGPRPVPGGAPEDLPMQPRQVPPRRRPWLAALLWLLFVTLAGAVAWLLLDACSLGLPGSAWRLSLPGACRAVAAGGADDLIRRNAALQDMIENAQLSLATKPFCPAPPPQPRQPDPPPHRDPDVTPGIEDRCRERQCETGLVQISVAWNSNADVDLDVECPNGKRIDFTTKGPGVCGDGKLDVDAQNNPNTRVPDPIENIRWQSPLPSGRYTVGITVFRYAGAPRPVRYDFLIKRGDESVPCRGQISTDQEVRQIVLTFDTNRPLPASCQPTR